MKEKIQKSEALATYSIMNGCMTVSAKLPSGTIMHKHFILDVLKMKCVSIYDLEFGFTDTDGFVYYFSISMTGQDMICYARSY